MFIIWATFVRPLHDDILHISPPRTNIEGLWEIILRMLMFKVTVAYLITGVTGKA